MQRVNFVKIDREEKLHFQYKTYDLSDVAQYFQRIKIHQWQNSWIQQRKGLPDRTDITVLFPNNCYLLKNGQN